jgi:hypothetical protein
MKETSLTRFLSQPCGNPNRERRKEQEFLQEANERNSWGAKHFSLDYFIDLSLDYGSSHSDHFRLVFSCLQFMTEVEFSDAAGAIAANPFNIAASMQIPPFVTARQLGESSGVQYRTNHSIVSHEGILYVFGGRSGVTYYSNVLKYNPSGMSWAELRVTGEVPLRRGDHSAVVVGSKMIIYGGRKQLNVMGDMFQLDLLTNTWSEVKFERTCSPGPVFSHASIASQKLRAMFVVGGVHEQENKRHLIHVFDLYGKYWKNIAGPPGIDPTVIHICQIGLSEASEKLFVLGLQDPMLASAALSPKPRKGGKKRVGENALLAPMRNPEGSGQVLSVYFLNLQTHVWTRVRTVVSPSSALSFTTPKMTELLLPSLHLCNSVVNTMKGCWYFFTLLNPSADADGPKPHDEQHAAHHHGAQQYGFFIFDFVELKWFLTPVTLTKGKQMQHEMPHFSAAGCSQFESKYSLTTNLVKTPGGSDRLTYVLFGGGIPSDHLFLLLTPTLPPHGKQPHSPRLMASDQPGDARAHTPQQDGDSNRRRRKRKEDNEHAVYIPLNPNFSATHGLLDSSGVPLIKLDSEEKLNSWMQTYYKDQCKWLVERRNEVENQFVKAQKAVKLKQAAASLVPKSDTLDAIDVVSVDSDGSDVSDPKELPPKKGAGPQPTLKNIVTKKVLKRVTAIRRIQLPPNSIQYKREQRNAQIEKKFCVRQLLFDSIEFTALPLLEGRAPRQQAAFLAKLRWKLLQKWVLSGEAALALRDESSQRPSAFLGPAPFVPSMPISSVPQLSLVPRLAFHRDNDDGAAAVVGRNGPQHPLGVPQRPVPYFIPAPPPMRLDAPRVLSNSVVQYELTLGRRQH